jgi:hypothetical protein
MGLLVMNIYYSLLPWLVTMKCDGLMKGCYCTDINRDINIGPNFFVKKI